MVFIIPLGLLPLALVINGENDIPGTDQTTDCKLDSSCQFDSGNVARFAYCLILMASFWISECVPIPVTALFPYFLFPLFGLASGELTGFFFLLNCP